LTFSFSLTLDVVALVGDDDTVLSVPTLLSMVFLLPRVVTAMSCSLPLGLGIVWDGNSPLFLSLISLAICPTWAHTYGKLEVNLIIQLVSELGTLCVD
jgi:hypothetical protein